MPILLLNIVHSELPRVSTPTSPAPSMLPNQVPPKELPDKIIPDSSPSPGLLMYAAMRVMLNNYQSISFIAPTYVPYETPSVSPYPGPTPSRFPSIATSKGPPDKTDPATFSPPRLLLIATTDTTFKILQHILTWYKIPL